MTVTGKTGTTYRTYRLDPVPIGSGGEGDVYGVIGMDKVAKIYRDGALTKELEEKLRIMIEHPPSESVLIQVAWPLDIVYDGEKCIGFIMPKLNINAELGEIYKYPSALPLSAHQKINIAQNICVVISEVHKAGYVFGDFNPRNIGLDKDTGLVSFLDTDTYHVPNTSNNKTYRCNVCAPGYAAPELLEKCSDYVAENPTASKSAYAETPLPTFTRETDNFALAIHIFKLLMNGYTPFGGIIETASVSQSSPGVGDAAVRRDSYCFKPGYKHQSAAIMPLDALPQEIADLFTRAFIIGKHDPKQRPDAAEWHNALTKYEQSLVTCRDNPLHQYDRKNAACPLCEADTRYAAAVGGTVSQMPDLKQSTYTPPPVQVTAQTQMPINSPVQSSMHTPPHSSNPAPVFSTAQTPASGRNFLKIAGVLLILVTVLFAVFWNVDFGSHSLRHATGLAYVIIYQIFFLYQIFLGVYAIKHCQNASKTSLLQYFSVISFLLTIVLNTENGLSAFGFYPFGYALDPLFTFLFALSSALLLTGASKNEVSAVGGKLIRLTGVIYITHAVAYILMYSLAYLFIAYIENSLALYSVRYISGLFSNIYGFYSGEWHFMTYATEVFRLDIHLNYFAYIWIAFRLILGGSCIKFHRKSKLLLALAVINMIPALLIVVGMTAGYIHWGLYGYWMLFYAILAIYYSVPSVLLLIGAIKNSRKNKNAPFQHLPHKTSS